jgi:hypothetical protein
MKNLVKDTIFAAVHKFMWNLAHLANSLYATKKE